MNASRRGAAKAMQMGGSEVKVGKWPWHEQATAMVTTWAKSRGQGVEAAVREEMREVVGCREVPQAHN
jgi:O-methyltransferase involved in polyketide biosynthesis